MKILVVSGSRADLGLLHCPTGKLREAGCFEVDWLSNWGLPFAASFSNALAMLRERRPEIVLVLGDRYEILATAIAAHLERIAIAHIAGGDVTEGSYDDAMRDSISRMASIHFTTSFSSTARLVARGYTDVHLVGNPAVDYIMHETWQREREIEGDYVVVSYQPETIDDTVELERVNAAIAGRQAIWISANPDRGSDRIPDGVSYSHDRFLNLLYHCQEFIGNSSSMFYEAPFLKPGGVPCRMIGKRQRGRVVPWGGDGKASERITDILKVWPSS